MPLIGRGPGCGPTLAHTRAAASSGQRRPFLSLTDRGLGPEIASAERRPGPAAPQAPVVRPPSAVPAVPAPARDSRRGPEASAASHPLRARFLPRLGRSLRAPAPSGLDGQISRVAVAAAVDRACKRGRDEPDGLAVCGRSNGAILPVGVYGAGRADILFQLRYASAVARQGWLAAFSPGAAS